MEKSLANLKHRGMRCSIVGMSLSAAVSHPHNNQDSALAWRYSKEGTVVDFKESMQPSCKLLPLCPEGTYLRSIVVLGPLSSRQ